MFSLHLIDRTISSHSKIIGKCMGELAISLDHKEEQSWWDRGCLFPYKYESDSISGMIWVKRKLCSLCWPHVHVKWILVTASWALDGWWWLAHPHVPKRVPTPLMLLLDDNIYVCSTLVISPKRPPWVSASLRRLGVVTPSHRKFAETGVFFPW